jgi:hypothetical protein
LTYRDPQLDARGGQAAVAGMLNWRYSRGDTQFTLGGWVGRRLRLQARDTNNNPITLPDTDRRIFYAELEQRIPRTPFKIRADYIWGRDRNPAGGTTPRFLTPSDLQTVFLYALYEPNPRTNSCWHGKTLTPIPSAVATACRLSRWSITTLCKSGYGLAYATKSTLKSAATESTTTD